MSKKLARIILEMIIVAIIASTFQIGILNVLILWLIADLIIWAIRRHIHKQKESEWERKEQEREEWLREVEARERERNSYK